MNRRDFLKGTAALGAVSAAGLPAIGGNPLTDAQGFSQGIVARAAHKAAQAAMNESYVAFLHPHAAFDLVQCFPRDEWRLAYRCWRRNGRPGAADPRAILRSYREDLHFAVFEQTFSVCKVEGFGVIESSSMKRVE